MAAQTASTVTVGLVHKLNPEHALKNFQKPSFNKARALTDIVLKYIVA